MQGQGNRNEQIAVIIIACLGILLMVAAMIGFAIWDRPNAPIAAPKKLSPPSGSMRAAKPKGNPGSWVTSDDYPSRALQQEREGTAGFRLIISPDGRPTDCEITSSSGHSDLDSATCKALMRRARFNPALDASGKAVESKYVSRVRWQIPRF
jgi:periplasmic protein TonB